MFKNKFLHNIRYQLGLLGVLCFGIAFGGLQAEAKSKVSSQDIFISDISTKSLEQLQNNTAQAGYQTINGKSVMGYSVQLNNGKTAFIPYSQKENLVNPMSSSGAVQGYYSTSSSVQTTSAKSNLGYSPQGSELDGLPKSQGGLIPDKEFYGQKDRAAVGAANEANGEGQSSQTQQQPGVRAQSREQGTTVTINGRVPDELTVKFAPSASSKGQAGTPTSSSVSTPVSDAPKVTLSETTGLERLGSNGRPQMENQKTYEIAFDGPQQLKLRDGSEITYERGYKQGNEIIIEERGTGRLFTQDQTGWGGERVTNSEGKQYVAITKEFKSESDKQNFIDYQGDVAGWNTENGKMPSGPKPSGPYRSEVENTRFKKNENYNTSAYEAEGDCGRATNLGLACGETTKTKVEVIQMGSMLSQQAGAAITNVAGGVANSRAMQEGTQQASLRAAASQTKTTGIMSLGMGMINTGLGAMQTWWAMDHSKGAKEAQKLTKIQAGKNGVMNSGNVVGQAGDNGTGQEGGDGYVTGTTTITGNAIKNYRMNEDSGDALKWDVKDAGNDINKQNAFRESRKAQFDGKVQNMVGHLNRLGNQEQGAQKEAKKAATFGAFQSTLTGFSQLMTGAFSLKAAKEYDQAAKSLDAAKGAEPPKFDPLPNPPQAQANSPFSAPQTAAELAVGNEQTESTDDQIPEVPPGLAAPGGDGAGGGSGPAPGVFQAGKSQGPSGGGGGGLGGGGGGTAAAQPEREQTAGSLSMGGANGTYVSSGEAPRSGGGGGGGRSSDGESSPGGFDFAGMLAKFLPGSDEERGTDIASTNYGRAPASADTSILSRDVNIFGRIHQRYKIKNRSGAVGL